MNEKVVFEMELEGYDRPIKVVVYGISIEMEGDRDTPAYKDFEVTKVEFDGEPVSIELLSKYTNKTLDEVEDEIYMEFECRDFEFGPDEDALFDNFKDEKL